MITVLKASERGHAQHGWLDSRHTFSFADYYDPRRMGFGALRVINEDRIAGGAGFPTHPHRDMEIISYVIDGALEHEDSMGNATVIRPGEIQRMSAGTGVRHSEYNHSPDTPAHFLQIWILPATNGIAPGYGQKSFASDFPRNVPVLVVSRDGRQGSVTINQDVSLYAGKFDAPGEAAIPVGKGRRAWIQMIKGTLETEGSTLEPGDGAALTDIERVAIAWKPGAEFLVFDLP